MALFQHSVLNKYLSGIDEKQVDEAWEAFTAHFHNPEVQENIHQPGGGFSVGDLVPRTEVRGYIVVVPGGTYSQNANS